jgi:putative hydrolase of the HAD superfamily
LIPRRETPPARAVLLDLDDTLYPERTFFESGLAAVADFVAGDDPAERCAWRRRLFADLRDRGREGAFERIPVPAGQRAEGWRAALLQVYRSHRPEIAAFPDVDGFIARARLEDRRLAIVADGKSCEQWRKVLALGLLRRVDAVVCADDLDAPPASPEPLLAAAALLGVAPAACVYVSDDASKDFIAPNGLGMLTVQVRRSLAYPLARPAPHPAAEARRRVASLTEASDLLFGGSP